VVYEASAGALEAIAHRGLNADLRARIERLDAQAGTFIAQRAVKQRRTVTERSLAEVTEAVEPRLLASAGWESAVAAPFVMDARCSARSSSPIRRRTCSRKSR